MVFSPRHPFYTMMCSLGVSLACAWLLLQTQLAASLLLQTLLLQTQLATLLQTQLATTRPMG
jgi:hypothetical protein